MIKTIETIVLLSFFALLFSCSVAESENTIGRIDGDIDRKVIVDPTDAVLEILETVSMENAVIKVRLCIMDNGQINFAEFLEKDSTIDLPVSKQKNVLKTIFNSTRFEPRNVEEECGVFTIS